MNAPVMTLPTASFRCTEGSSNKEYHIQLVAKDDGYVCNYQYGAIGSTLTPGFKPAKPVPLEKGMKQFDKMVAERLAKSYVRSDGAVSAEDAIKQVEIIITGLSPQLLNPVDESELEALFDDPAWGMEEKKDGKRIILSSRYEGAVFATNRRGLQCPVPNVVADAIAQLPVNEIDLDGELIGDVFYVFDILSIDGKSCKHQTYGGRFATYSCLLGGLTGDLAVRLVPVPMETTSEGKRALFAKIKAEHGEGVVFKRLLSQYVPGRPNSGGDQLKFKFTESSSCIVLAVSETKRSIALAMLDEAGQMVEVGNATVPANQSIPVAGAVVEVRYLYKFDNGGSLFQPVLLGLRDDIIAAECLLTQVRRIKSRSEVADE